MKFDHSEIYARAFADSIEAHFGHRNFPNDLIESWASLLSEIKKGYDDIPPEYDHDVHCVKEELDYITSQAGLDIFPEH